ncbi:alpha-D-ribose 1-methylphosphonate 5-triphosphate synthase subunit PhnI [Ancylobacter sp. 3268]|uniref:carbon-phosphorus lyase complex subunit PhnI n=1 Tax=Ancylobacter sp. 3268 TaxID=2817752 RepID=UPI0028646E12|nr:carbon-phosphorus lyase complex subunit PhnI [Ancylobacter sp. 3268]MDR6951688.1 alpha-D-ribose 1-methylphosphonate 5-triphosphate synthase subunit PhnI [Ancylobacter sp. 3268]
MYVAAKGGEKAIRNAHELLAKRRRGKRNLPSISLEQIAAQLTLAVDRVMAEGSLYDSDLAALAIKQARGDLIEAIFLIRAFRTTLPRFGTSRPLDTGDMMVRRRVSATFKDLPGGQLLGPTFDYTHRLLDTSLAAPDGYGEVYGQAEAASGMSGEADPIEKMPRVTDLIGAEGLIEASPADDGSEPFDITRAPTNFPVDRATRLQTLARGDEGYLLALGYSTQRGYARSHPFVGEIRFGDVEVIIDVPELGFEISIGDIQLTECQMVNQFKGSAEQPPQFTRGYGLVFGQCERKAMSMALVERALRWAELGEEPGAPAQDEEFVLSHCDNVQATGFVEHLKLPHYVDFQAELDLVRRMRREALESRQADAMKEAAE